MIIRIAILSFISLSLIACSTSIGTTHLYRVENKKLVSPWDELQIDGSDESIIYKTTEKKQLEGSDTFSIFVKDAYFRYLPDLGGINEVIVVAEFTEADSNNGERLVKVLGPYRNVADMTKSAFFNKPIYGPKRLESDLLSIDIKIYEYDQEEKKNNAAMLDFIGDLGGALNVANPVTSAEIALAKKVAKTINSANKNDLVLHADMTFIAGDDNLAWSVNKSIQGLVLKAGELVLIKQEACQVGSCFTYFSSADGRNPVAWLADGVMAVPVAFNRGLTDSPDSNALASMDKKKREALTVGDYGVENESKSLYEEKTWMRINIVKGGDPSKWEARKALWELENEIQDTVKTADTDSSLEALGRALAEAKGKIEAIVPPTPITISTPNAYDSVHYFYSDTNNAGLCLQVAQGVTLKHAALKGEDNTEITLVAAAASPQNISCYTLETGNLNEGKYNLSATYLLSEKLQTKWFSVQSILKPMLSAGENAISCETKDKFGMNTRKIIGTNLQHVTSIKVNGEYIDTTSPTQTSLLLKSASGNIESLKTGAGEIKLTASIALNTCE